MSPFLEMINYTTAVPLAEAVKSLAARTPLAKALSSKEWESVPREIRDRAFFISRVESERILVEAQKRILQRVKLQREQLAEGGEDVTMDRGRFIQEMQGVLDQVGYQPRDQDRGRITDVSSAGRLGLIWDMQLAQAHGFAAWKQGTSAVSLDRAPCQELVRISARREPRDWPQVWADNGGKFYGEPSADYPDAPGRMIAHKLDPIWRKISRFDTPWPPFDWGSGMGLRVVRRRDADALGVPDPDPAWLASGGSDATGAKVVPFNNGLQASAKGLPVSSIAKLQEEMGDAIKVQDDTITWQRDTTAANPYAERPLADELVARVADLMDTAPDHVGGFDLPTTLLQQLAQVATGQLAALLFPGLGKVAGVLDGLAAWLPESVKLLLKDGLLAAWRPDLNPAPVEVAA